MAKQISLTFSDAVFEAMQAKGAIFDLSPAEWLKNHVNASAMGSMAPLGLAGALEKNLATPTPALLKDGELFEDGK